MEFCERCNKDVITFKQEYTTMPQADNNQVRRYLETFCALCGHCVDSKVVDEVPTKDK